MNARISSSAVVVVTLMLLISCFPDYFPRRKLKVNLSAVQMAGHWQLTNASARMLARYRVSVTPTDSFIEFFADGRCELHKFVDQEDAISGAGNWKIEQNPIQAKSSVMHIAYRTAQRPFVSSLSFTRRQGKIILWQYHSDPDGREYVEYERK